MMLEYLAFAFDHLSDMNLSLQGRDVTVSDIKESWLRKLLKWASG